MKVDWELVASVPAVVVPVVVVPAVVVPAVVVPAVANYKDSKKQMENEK